MRLESSAQRGQPTVPAGERALPVLEPLRDLLPKGMRRGTSVQVDGVGEGVGSTSLALALVAGPSSLHGSWVAVVGVPTLGLRAAAGYGVDLRRLVMVPEVPVEAWGAVVATLLDAFEVVLVRSVGRVRAGVQRRLQAITRERGAVLVRLGDGWAEGADTSLRVVGTEWHGLGQGHGHLRARRATVEAGGRRGDDRARRVDLWLPAPGGGLALAVTPAATSRPAPQAVPERVQEAG